MILHGYLKQGLRLNRSMGYGFLLIALAACIWGEHSFSWAIRLGAFSLVTIILMVINEAALRLLKRFPQTEPLFLEKFSVLTPTLSFAATVMGYICLGQLGIGLMMFIPIFQAQFYGHHRLTQGLLALSALILGVGTFFNWNVGLPTLPLYPVLQWVPFLFVMFQYGAFVSTSVRASTSHLSRLQSLAATDGLTGLINRRQFNHQLQSEIARARRHNLPLTLALFDIDNFKRLNDQYGHPIGDRILKELGTLVTLNIRECDVSARYGGEEFALILPETRLTEANDILERLRGLVEKTVFCLPDNPLTMTISVGIAQFDPDHPTAFELVEKSDAALYEAKRQGKNRVVYGVIPTPKISLSRAYSQSPITP